MPSFLSRIRYRTSSTQPPALSAPPPPASPSLEATPNIIDATPSSLRGLKIRPDLNALMESYETEDTSPRHQNKGSPVVAAPSSSQDGYSPLSPNPNMSRNTLTKSPELTSPTTPVSTGRHPPSPPFAEGSPIGGTFGRQQSPLANLSSVGSGSSHHRAPTRSWSLGDTANLNQKLTNAQWSGWTQTPTSQLPLSGTFERSSSMRTLPDKKRRIDRRRRTNTRSLTSLRTSRSTSPATPRPNRTPSSITHQSRSDSPRTFGHPTPPYSTRTFGHHESPPPPLPRLDHPELILDARGLKPATLDILDRSSRSATTIFHVDNTPGIPREPASGPSVRHCKPTARKRSKTYSVDSRRSSRRSSAEWSSVQATEGVLTDSNSWQAQVSREIVRLSLGEPVALPGQGDPGSSRDFSHVPATRHAPVEAFVSPRPASSLGSLLFLQDSNPLSSPSEYCGGDQAVVTGDEYNKYKRMTEQGTSTLQVANNPSNTKGKQPLKSSLRASSSTPRYSAISTVLATPTRLENQSSDSSVSKGKRKADEIDITPPDQKSLHAKFAVPEDLPLEKRTGSDLQVPPSFRAKRARLSTSSHSPSPSRPGLNATNTGTWTSSTSSKLRSLSRQQSVTKPPSSKTNSYRSDIPSDRVRVSERYERTRSMSQLSHTSIPVSALVSPRAPSVSRSMSSAYHMRDPRKPPRVQPTPWSLRFRTEDEDGSPIHAWFFFLGFILFPLWWLASVWRIPQTRSVGGSEVEKAVTLDDPQVEHDARTWRFRCRIMAGVALITYIPFIVLVAHFVH